MARGFDAEEKVRSQQNGRGCRKTAFLRFGFASLTVEASQIEACICSRVEKAFAPVPDGV